MSLHESFLLYVIKCYISRKSEGCIADNNYSL